MRYEAYQIHVAFVDERNTENYSGSLGTEKGSLEDEKQISVEGDYKGGKQKRDLRTKEELVT